MFRRSLTRELAKRAKGNSPSDPVEEILDRCEEELESLSSLEKGGYADQIADEEKERVSLLRRLLITTQAGDEASLGKLLEYATIELSRITAFQSETESRLGDDQKQWEWEQTQTGSQADDEN